MLFNSAQFLFVFLPLVLLLVLLAKAWSPLAARFVLAAASLYFYSQGDAGHLALLVASTLFNYWVGGRIQGAQTAPHRTRWVYVGVSANLLNLAVFKYLNFFTGVADGLVAGLDLQTDILLPLGISFYTFTQIAYLIDSADGKVREKGLVDYSLFVWYFPHQIAGPILHHKEMLSQFRSEAFGVRAEQVLIGLCIFGFGLFKKVVIADWFERMATPIFSAAGQGVAPGFFEGWVGACAYALQIYFDFSAYCDMAIGVSYMFGVKLPANFDSPYQSNSIIEFWRRWHLTLSRFLRDYLYIPLGGNRKGEGRRQINLMITMVLGGFWHGASWNFLIWGFLHGTYLTINHQWVNSAWRQRCPLPRILAWGLTMLAVLNAWVFFRAATLTEALTILSSMYGLHEVIWPALLQPYMPWLDASQFSSLWAGKLTRGFHVLTLLVGVTWCVWVPNLNQWFAHAQPTLDNPGRPVHGAWATRAPGILLAALVLGWAISRLGEDSAFIYFNF